MMADDTMTLADAFAILECEVEQCDADGSYWQAEDGGPKWTTRQAFERIKAELDAQVFKIPAMTNEPPPEQRTPQTPQTPRSTE